MAEHTQASKHMPQELNTCTWGAFRLNIFWNNCTATNGPGKNSMSTGLMAFEWIDYSKRTLSCTLSSSSSSGLQIIAGVFLQIMMAYLAYTADSVSKIFGLSLLIMSILAPQSLISPKIKNRRKKGTGGDYGALTQTWVQWCTCPRLCPSGPPMSTWNWWWRKTCAPGPDIRTNARQGCFEYWTTRVSVSKYDMIRCFWNIVGKNIEFYIGLKMKRKK